MYVSSAIGVTVSVQPAKANKVPVALDDPFTYCVSTAGDHLYLMDDLVSGAEAGRISKIFR